MGVKGGLVRSIFFRNKSFGAHDYNTGRSNLGEKKRWSSSVRSYLCGDEFNSVLAVNDSDSDALITTSQQLSSDLCLPFGSVIAIEDSASVKHWVDDDDDSVKSSEATVIQPLQKEDEISKEEDVEDNKSEEDAAVRIQTAFRSYMAIRKSLSGDKSQGNVSSSMGTSLEAQTCGSVKTQFYRRKQVSANPRTLQNNKAQVLKIKEDWDDSTVSSTVSKSRIQNRIEAMTKRERALAYAFSQQLRICSKKKQLGRNDEDDSNIGLSWLERWMATRIPENIPVETRTNIQTDIGTKNQRLVIKNRSFGIAGELESCASNDIPLHFESILETQEEKTKDFQRIKNSPKASISKRKSIPSYKSQRRLQTTKSDLQQQTKKAKKAKTTTSMGDECGET